MEYDDGTLALVTITITVVVPPAIGLSPARLGFTGIAGGPNPADQTLQITNTGGGTLNWKAASNQAWLTAAPASGDTTTETDEVTVRVGAAGLPAGSYSGTLSVSDPTASNDPQAVPVSLTVRSRPVISLSASNVTFAAVEDGAEPAAQSVTVANANTAANPIALSWTAAENPDAPWLTLTSASGKAGDALALAAAIGGLTPGNYSATIEVNDSNAANSPQQIAVSFVVTAQPQPVIALSQTSLTFTAISGAAKPAAQTVDLTNPGNAKLAWTAASDQNWLTVTPASDDTASETDTLTVSADNTGLAPGTYSATISVSDPVAANDPQAIAITLTVQSRPVIGLSATAVTFTAIAGGEEPAAQSVTVADANTAANPILLSWTAAENPDAPWLTLTGASGKASDAVTLAAATGTLTPGVYNATVEISDANASNNPQTVDVTFAVSKPAIGVSPTSLTFTAPEGGPDPAAQTVQITNMGAVTLNWTAAADKPWVQVSPFGDSTTTETDTLTVKAVASQSAAWSGSLSTTGAPPARRAHSAVWTGAEMIIWGGYDGNYLGEWRPLRSANR